jgi:LPS-assembly lipoprotein
MTMTRILAPFLLLAALAMGGCGFTPLYAQQGVVAGMTGIDVVAPEGRAGYLLRQHLDDTLARRNGEPAAYRMQLSLGEARYPRGIRIDNVATRYEYVLTANYVLTEQPSGAVAKRGVVRVELTYDSADQPYASITAQQEAQDRAAQEAARRIQLEVAAWLANGAKTKG